MKKKKSNEFWYAISDLGNGGQERQLYYLITMFIKYGIFPTVVIWNTNINDKYYSLFKDTGVNIIEFMPSESNFKKIVKLRKYLSSRKPTLLHSYTFSLNFLIWLCCVGSKTVPIGCLRSSYIYLYNEIGKLRSVLSGVFPRNLISNNQIGANELQKKLPFTKNKKIFIIHNAINLHSFEFKVSNKTTSYLNTVSIGRLSEEKRIDWLIQLIAAIKSYNIKINHRHAGDGYLKEFLINMTKNLDIQDEFKFVGNIDDINAFILSSDILIHSSSSEGSPNVVMESMASGKPVFSTDCGDVGTIIDHGINGWVTNSKNIEDFIDNFKNFILESDLKNLGIAARCKIEDNFSIEAHYQNVLTAYHQITKGGNYE